MQKIEEEEESRGTERPEVLYQFHRLVRNKIIFEYSQSQWPRGLRLGSATGPLVRLRVRVLRGHGRPYVVNAVFCQAGVSAKGRSLV